MSQEKDYCIRVTAKNGAIRGFFATTKNIANESFNIHKTSPVVTAGMGRLLTATSMLGFMQKGEKDLMTITIKGDGPMKGLLATSSSNGYVKGYPYNPMVDIPLKENGKLDVSGAIGEDEGTEEEGQWNKVEEAEEEEEPEDSEQPREEGKREDYKMKGRKRKEWKPKSEEERSQIICRMSGDGRTKNRDGEDGGLGGRELK